MGGIRLEELAGIMEIARLPEEASSKRTRVYMAKVIRLMVFICDKYSSEELNNIRKALYSKFIALRSNTYKALSLLVRVCGEESEDKSEELFSGRADAELISDLVEVVGKALVLKDKDFEDCLNILASDYDKLPMHLGTTEPTARKIINYRLESGL